MAERNANRYRDGVSPEPDILGFDASLVGLYSNLSGSTAPPLLNVHDGISGRSMDDFGHVGQGGIFHAPLPVGDGASPLAQVGALLGGTILGPDHGDVFSTPMYDTTSDFVTYDHGSVGTPVTECSNGVLLSTRNPDDFGDLQHGPFSGSVPVSSSQNESGTHSVQQDGLATYSDWHYVA